MKFWDKLQEKILPGFDRREYIKIAKSGERIEAFVESGAFDVFIEEILDPMERDAFEVFKKLNPTAITEVIQAQKIAQIVSEIKRRVERKIQNGLDARQQILDNSTQEGE